MIQTGTLASPSFSPPLFSPVPSPPPPSPTSPNHSRSRSHPLRRNPKRAVFDIVSTSPQSFDSAEKTMLKTRLERSRKLRIAVKPGVPARLLSDKEVDSSNSSSGLEQGNAEGGSKGKGTSDEKETESPWITDSDPPTRTTSPITELVESSRQEVGSTSKQAEEKEKETLSKRNQPTITKKGIRVEGFHVRGHSQPIPDPVSSTVRPPFSRSTSASTSSRSTSASTSSLSLLLARTPFPAPDASRSTTPLPPSTSSNDPAPSCSARPGKTWNGDVVAEKLASQSRAATPSTSPATSTRTLPPTMQPRPPYTLSSSASLPSLARQSSLKRTRFLTPSACLTSTPSSSPPESPNVLNFTRRSRSRQRSLPGRDLRATMVLHHEPESDLDETKVEETSDCEELEDFNRFQPSIFASHYSNSATSLSSMSSSTLRTTSSVSSSPKSTKGIQLAASVPNVPVSSAPDPVTSRRVSSEPKHVNLRDFRRQQLAQKEKLLESTGTDSERSTPRPSSKQQVRRDSTTTSPVSPTSLPYLQLPWKKLFSHN
ncbi:uncharacterized protein JCM6883_003934 [Sporobolomyces salmoneus]|uniref:uncharacterized protein n=1 Tax=Sporobolomyces salmoneus TaxID=183962 RepID=UPI003174AF2C